MSDYFDSIMYYNMWGKGWLSRVPKKSEVLKNAKIAGNAFILGGSNNRALIIADGDNIYLQSYDTLMLRVNRATGEIEKLSDYYSATTIKHINAFMSAYNGQTFNKAAWLAFKGV